MRVYGDHARRADPRKVIERLRGLRGDELLIEAGELAQGLLDVAMRARGEVDDWGELEACCAGLMDAAVRQHEVGEELSRFAAVELPAEVRMRVPEGYAFYALYPALYAAAARELRGKHEGERWVVIGLRSIGTGLAAVVARELETQTWGTVRPVGHPFDRRVNVGERLRERLLVKGARYAVVDEGPGLSGSSMNAVADWLMGQGVAEDRICFLPGHDGELGPEAKAEHRERWERACRVVASFERMMEQRGFFEEGRTAGELGVMDVSGGKWREVRRVEVAVVPHMERRKYLYEHGGKRWLAKFAGLGRYGREVFERGRALGEAGFSPAVRGLRNGFVVSEWIEEARAASGAVDVADYLAFVAQRLPAESSDTGATPPDLLEMVKANVREAMGDDAAEAVERWRERLPGVGRRVRIDGRLHRWEWLVTDDGRVLKTDATDHWRGHDCIGVQEIAWDVAGAVVELGADEADLVGRLGERGVEVADARGRAFYRLAYAAFWMGYYEMFTPGSEEARRYGRWVEGGLGVGVHGD